METSSPSFGASLRAVLRSGGQDPCLSAAGPEDRAQRGAPRGSRLGDRSRQRPEILASSSASSRGHRAIPGRAVSRDCTDAPFRLGGVLGSGDPPAAPASASLAGSGVAGGCGRAHLEGQPSSEYAGARAPDPPRPFGILGGGNAPSPFGGGASRGRFLVLRFGGANPRLVAGIGGFVLAGGFGCPLGASRGRHDSASRLLSTRGSAGSSPPSHGGPCVAPAACGAGNPVEPVSSWRRAPLGGCHI